MFGPVANALWGHYRRHPFQILLVWLGLTLGIALLVGVMAVNEQAKESYRQGERLFANPFPYRIHNVQSGLKVPQGFYIQLRRAGFKTCTPIFRHRITTDKQRDFELLGIDPVAMFSVGRSQSSQQPLALDLIKPPYPLMVGRELANYMGFEHGQMLTLSDGQTIGPLNVVNDELVGGARMIADMALLRKISPSAGLTSVVCGDMSPQTLAELKEMLPRGLTIEHLQSAKLEPLTQAFHLNLFAMGMLAFVIGLFIFYQAMSLSLSQRQPLVGLMRQVGVSGFQLGTALAIELFIWLALGLVGGNLLGLVLAQQLLPAVSSTLNDLYGATVNLAVSWRWQWGLSSLMMAIAGSLLACGWPLARLVRTRPARLATHMALVRFTGREFGWQALLACLFCIAAIAVYQAPHSQLAGFVLIALILIATGLIMPYLLWMLFRCLSHTVRSAQLRWFFSDAAASLSYRGVAAMAFMLALASNIGMETMVGSFRTTTEAWLGQRLAADVYVRPSLSMAPRIQKWLEEQPEIDEVWWQWRKKISTDEGTLQVVSIGTSTGEMDALSIKVAVPDYWYNLHSKRSVLVSESLALKQGWGPGDVVDFPAPMKEQWRVAGIYYDYGNPYGQVMVSHNMWHKLWPRDGQVGLAVHLSEGSESREVLTRLGDRFRLRPERVQNNAELMERAMQVFDRTFVVTETLGNLTLIIAIIGLFVATVAGEVSRQRQFALLRCMGMSGRELAALGGGQLMVIGVMTALLALPLGLLLAQLLIDVVIKYSFGWTMPVQFFPLEYLFSLGSALIALLAAGAWPVWRLVKRSAILSLREAL